MKNNIKVFLSILAISVSLVTSSCSNNEKQEKPKTLTEKQILLKEVNGDLNKLYEKAVIKMDMHHYVDAKKMLDIVITDSKDLSLKTKAESYVNKIKATEEKESQEHKNTLEEAEKNRIRQAQKKEDELKAKKITLITHINDLKVEYGRGPSTTPDEFIQEFKRCMTAMNGIDFSGSKWSHSDFLHGTLDVYCTSWQSFNKEQKIAYIDRTISIIEKILRTRNIEYQKGYLKVKFYARQESTSQFESDYVASYSINSGTQTKIYK